MSGSECAPLELMSVVLSRELRDGETGGAGVAALIPMAAMLLARELHAPNLVIGGERVYNPKPKRLYEDGQDARNFEGAEAIEGYWELFGHSHRGVDFFFYSGIQIDRYGNANLHHVGGTFERPAFRGPGVPNVSFAVTSKRVLLYPVAHNARTFVERVDFVSVPGHLRGPESKRAAGLMHGPALCVTPIAVMDFDPETLAMRLRSVHGGLTAAQVQERTGFPLVMPARVPETEPPTDRELTSLREVVDPAGLLRRTAAA